MQVFKGRPRKKLRFIFLKSLAVCHAEAVLSDRAKAHSKGKQPTSVGNNTRTLITEYTCTHGKYIRKGGEHYHYIHARTTQDTR